MGRRDRLLGRMRSAPGSIRFDQIRAFLQYEGFAIINQRGSHVTFHHPIGACS